MLAELIPALVPLPDGPPRTPGWHLSSLIKAMALDYGFLDAKWADDFELVEAGGESQAEWWASLDEDSRLRMGMGMAWEAWYLPQVPGVACQPGELELAKIYMTRDGESLSAILPEWGWGIMQKKHCIALHEVKTTSKSINTVGDISVPNRKNWMWLMQLKGYCKAMGTLLAYLHILYHYGDYSRPFRPKLHVWRVMFDQDEVDEAWDKVVEYRDQHVIEGV